jgi:hypothetical protein
MNNKLLSVSFITIILFCVTTYATMTVAASSLPVVITDVGVVNLHGKVVTKLDDGQGYFIIVIIKNRSNQSQNFQGQGLIDGKPVFGFQGSGLPSHYATMFSVGEFFAVTGKHKLVVELCSDSSCSKVLQKVPYNFTVTP